MALPLQLPPDGYLRLSFSGEVGVAGAPAQQSWDLSPIPASVRASEGFTRSFIVLARPLTPGLVEVEVDVSFIDDADGIPSEMVLSVTAGAPTDQLSLDVWCLHSIIGAVSDTSKAYFIQNPGTTADVSSVFGRTGNVIAQLGDYAASLVTNDSGVAGATVDLALDALAAIIAALDSDDIANNSGVAGATVTAALDTLAAVIAALDSSDIANVSGVVGATVTDALNTIDAALIALTGAAPADVDKSAAQVGVATTAARADHKHDVSTAAASGTVEIGDAGAEGVSTALARADHVHPVGTPAAPVNVTKAAAATGTSVIPARADHKHDVDTASPSAAVDIGDAAAEGVATTLARSDHQHAVPAPAGVPPAVAAAGAVGAATTPARSDHTHAHGSQPLGGGTDHAVATAAVAGFMSAADKSKLDGIEAGAVAPIFWGGANMGGGDVGKHFGAQQGDNGGKAAALTTANQMTSGRDGNLAWLTWNSAAADATTIFKVVVNGLVVETKNLTGVQGVLSLSAAIARGDLVAVEYDAGTSPGNTTVQVYAS